MTYGIILYGMAFAIIWLVSWFLLGDHSFGDERHKFDATEHTEPDPRSNLVEELLQGIYELVDDYGGYGSGLRAVHLQPGQNNNRLETVVIGRRLGKRHQNTPGYEMVAGSFTGLVLGRLLIDQPSNNIKLIWGVHPSTTNGTYMELPISTFGNDMCLTQIRTLLCS